jgi:DNA-binding XRE family transcriptional regulator
VNARQVLGELAAERGVDLRAWLVGSMRDRNERDWATSALRSGKRISEGWHARLVARLGLSAGEAQRLQAAVVQVKRPTELRQRRLALGLSLGAVAAEVGCSRTSIQQIEDAVPSLAHGPAAARYELLLSRLERGAALEAAP